MLANAEEHEMHMLRAVTRARAATLPFAAVLVRRRSGRVVAEGVNRVHSNPTWHAEIDAINVHAAGATALPFADLVLYTTAEPCPMCQSAIVWAGIETVVFGTSMSFLMATGWQQIDIGAAEIVRRSAGSRCVVIGGVSEAACNALFSAGPPPPRR